MPTPGHSVIWLDQPNTSAQQGVDTRQGFIVAEAERGPLFPVRCTSLAAVVAKFGARQTYSYLYDAAETAFNEGCPAIWVSRIASATAVKAVRVLSDGAATTLTVRPLGPGAYGNSQYVEIQTNAEDATIPSGSFRIRYYDGGSAAANLVETSPIFLDKTEALAWAPSNGLGSSQYFALTDDVGTADPSALAAASGQLGTGSGGNTAGVDDRGSIVDADWQTAIDKFTMDLGPGQIAMPGQTTSTRILMVVAHARTRNRHALWDYADTSTIATLTTGATTINAAPSSGARFSSGWWPWARVAALAGSSGFRTVPMSAAMMGRMASAEKEGGDAGIAASGESYGTFAFVQDLSQDVGSLSDANLQTLNDAGVNVARKFYGIERPVMYGNRTPRLRGIDPVWAEASGSRLAMAIAAEGDQILRSYVHTRSNSTSRAQCQTRLATMLEKYRQKGALYGDTPQEAFTVDATSEAINPPVDLEAGTFRASIAYRTSPSPETVVLQLARVSITSALPVAA